MPRNARVLLVWAAGVVAVLGVAGSALVAAGLPLWADIAVGALAVVVALLVGGALALRVGRTPAPVSAAGCGACGQSCLRGVAGSGSLDSRECISTS